MADKVIVTTRTHSVTRKQKSTPNSNKNALTVNRTQDLQIFSLTLSQLSYQGVLAVRGGITVYINQQKK